MYLVTIINDNIETVINHISTNNKANRISGTVKQGINCINSFTFTIYPNNEGYNLIFPYKTLVKVYNTKTNKYEFIGRVLKPTGSMDGNGIISKSFVCESELAYLIDSIQMYGEYHNISPRDYLKLMLDNHNKSVDEFKQFQLGNVTVTDPNDSLYKYLAYDTTWKNINEDLIDTLGGELQIRYENDIRYLDYLEEIGKVCSTEIRLGKNIQDITEDKDPTEYYTRLIPLGNKLQATDSEGNEVDTDERLTISSVNNGLNYIDDEEAIEEFGIIQGFVTFDDVSDANNLLKKGEIYLASQRITISDKITALDLSLIGLDIDSFEVANYYPLNHDLLDIDYTIRIIEKSISIESPEKSTLTFGDKEADIKDYQLSLKKQANKTVQLESKVNAQSILISNTNKSLNQTSQSLEKVSSEVSNLGNSTNETINKMVESIQLLTETVTNINDNLIAVNKTLDSINQSLNETNESIIALDERVKVLEGESTNG